MSEIQTYTPSNGAMLVCSSGGDYIKTKDHLATITRLEAENAELKTRLLLFKCKDCTDIAALREEVEAIKRADATGYDRFELGKQFTNRALRTRLAAAEKELAELKAWKRAYDESVIAAMKEGK